MKILVVSDSGVPSGYGRIADEMLTRLTRRGVEVMAASLLYDGLLPAQYEGQRLPYHVGSLAGHAEWPAQVAGMVGATRPDIVVVIQDATYAMQVRHIGIDWSTTAFAVVTPVDGAPIYPGWVEMMRGADAALTISRFGVEAYARQGVRVDLCRPGINPDAFFRLRDDERAALRDKLGIAPGAFVLGTMAQNQGRKAITLMLKAFFAFAQGRPDARYFLDMEPQSPAGWDIPALCQQYGWDASKLIWRSAALQVGVTGLRERYNLLDAHAVISHREGYGIPLVEAMACGVTSMALDYCSGPEIVGEGRGVLIPAIDYGVPGTWGGAEDRFPDMGALVGSLERLAREPGWRAFVAEAGMGWARRQTWDEPTDNLHAALSRVYAARFGAQKAGAA